MMKKSHRFLLIFLLFALSYSISKAGNKTGHMTNHIILAVDQALPINYRHILSQNQGVINAINDVLTLNGENIVNQDDYFSLINFLADEGANSLDDFAIVPQDNSGRSMSWVKADGNVSLFLSNGDWGKIMYRDSKGERQSLLSAAKQASLIATKDGGKANRTFMVMVTDDHFNGLAEVSHDLDNFLNSSSTMRHNKNIIKNTFLNKCLTVNANYSFNYIQESVIYGTYRAMLFEVVPTYSASLPILLRYPSTYNLNRVKGGYLIEFNYEERNNKYHLDSLILETCGYLYTHEPTKKQMAKLFIPSNSVVGDSIEIIMKGWFLQQDGIYNCYLYNPDNQFHDSKSHDLLVMDKIGLPKEATVFSIPLSDNFWFWYREDASKAAFIWEVIIVFILLIIISIIVRRLVGMYIKVAQRYEPNDKDIKVKKIS